MQREDDFLTSLPLFTAVVEARNDPAMLGRVRVRVHGIHSPDRTELPTECLPWATVMMPVTSAGNSGIMSAPPALVESTWTLVFFRDGNSFQDPVILGVLPGTSPPRWGGLSLGGDIPSCGGDSSTTPNPLPADASVSPDKKLETKLTTETTRKISDQLNSLMDTFAFDTKMKAAKDASPLIGESQQTISDVLTAAHKVTPTDFETIKNTSPLALEDAKKISGTSLSALKSFTPVQASELENYINQL